VGSLRDSYYASKVPHLSPIKGYFGLDILKLNISYRGIAKCTPVNCSSISLREDCFDEQPLSI